MAAAKLTHVNAAVPKVTGRYSLGYMLHIAFLGLLNAGWGNFRTSYGSLGCRKFGCSDVPVQLYMQQARALVMSGQTTPVSSKMTEHIPAAVLTKRTL